LVMPAAGRAERDAVVATRAGLVRSLTSELLGAAVGALAALADWQQPQRPARGQECRRQDGDHGFSRHHASSIGYGAEPVDSMVASLLTTPAAPRRPVAGVSRPDSVGIVIDAGSASSADVVHVSGAVQAGRRNQANQAAITPAIDPSPTAGANPGPNR